MHFELLSSLQVVDPKKDIPKGLLGSLGVVTVLYVLMSATIVLMVPYTDINPKAAFAAAFEVIICLQAESWSGTPMAHSASSEVVQCRCPSHVCI